MEEIGKVEKKGNVTIIRLRKKEFRPRQKPCFKRFLIRLKSFFIQEPKEITGDQLINLIIQEFGDNNYHLLISDDKYRVISKEQMEQLLQDDDTNQLPYISEYADTSFKLAAV
jgi:hypothetical protein